LTHLLTNLICVGKIFAIFFPITSFIAIGFDHLVANMYFIPLAMMNGANISGAEFVLNLVLLTVGNTFGGLILVGFLYWAAYGRQPVKKSSDLHYELLEDRK
jgi:formate/nitrite transporter FocA (FNT family)